MTPLRVVHATGCLRSPCASADRLDRGGPLGNETGRGWLWTGLRGSGCNLAWARGPATEGAAGHTSAPSHSRGLASAWYDHAFSFSSAHPRTARRGAGERSRHCPRGSGSRPQGERAQSREASCPELVPSAIEGGVPQQRLSGAMRATAKGLRPPHRSGIRGASPEQRVRIRARWHRNETRHDGRAARAQH